MITKEYTYTDKSNGQTLSADEWNKLTHDVNAAITEINNPTSGSSSSSSSSVADTVISVSSKGNTEISSAKHINLEPAYVDGGGEGTYGDIQFKPGDDITLESSHRATGKQGEITIKTSNGKSKDDPDKGTVKLELKAADLELSTEGKPGNDQNVMNVNVTTGNGKGYLKVRAQAIDLRCEDHGGIALQPKGEDSDHHMNKIKFEHGGGDGLEFGTFNTEKTSIFTDEYRFNKDGVWKMATRQTLASDKADASDATTAYKYVKQADDFYDVISSADPRATTEQIITAGSMVKVSPAYLLTSSAIPADTSSIDTYHYTNISNSFISGNYYTAENILNYIDSDDPTISSEFIILDGNDDPIEYWNVTEAPHKIVDISAKSSSDTIRINNEVDITENIYADKNTNIMCNSKLCKLEDIIDLVAYFKTGAGASNGPWANNL